MSLRAKSYVMTSADVEPVENCPAASVYAAKRPKPGPAQWHGIFVHRFLEYAQTRGRDAALRYVRSKSKGAFNVCSKLDLSRLPRGDTEVSFAVDLRDESATTATYADCDPERHMFCRLDIVWFEDYPFTANYKTGDRPYDPKTFTQFKLDAVALWLTYDRPAEVSVECINIVSQPQGYNEKKKGPWDPIRRLPHIWQAPDIEKQMKRFKRAHLKMIETRAEFLEEEVYPSFNPGEHCISCRSRFSCKRAYVPPKPEKKEKAA